MMMTYMGIHIYILLDECVSRTESTNKGHIQIQENGKGKQMRSNCQDLEKQKNPNKDTCRKLRQCMISVTSGKVSAHLRFFWI